MVYTGVWQAWLVISFEDGCSSQTLKKSKIFCISACHFYWKKYKAMLCWTNPSNQFFLYFHFWTYENACPGNFPWRTLSWRVVGISSGVGASWPLRNILKRNSWSVLGCIQPKPQFGVHVAWNKQYSLMVPPTQKHLVIWQWSTV